MGIAAGKGIKAIKGSLSITDLFDEDLGTFNIVIEDPVEVGIPYVKGLEYPYNKFIQKHVALGQKKLSQIKTTWKTEKIIFMDNSSLE